MKKILLLAGLMMGFYFGFSQTISDTQTLRTRINQDIVPNGTKSIIAVKMNEILNGYLNAWPPAHNFFDSSSYNTITKLNDSTFTLNRRDGTKDTVQLRSNGGGGGSSTDKLNDVAARDSALNHTILAISPSTKDTTAIQDSIVYHIDFSSNTANNGLKPKLLSRIQSDKYGLNDPAGKPYGRWNTWFISNNYNGVGARRGEILYPFSYNTNSGGGKDINGEASLHMGIESDYGRQFEIYWQVTDNKGTSYRPTMYNIFKDTSLCFIVNRANQFTVNLLDTAMDYLTAENGKLTINKVPGRTSPGSSTILSLKNSGVEMFIQNNGTQMQFTGANFYPFDNTIYPINDATQKFGLNTARWKALYTKAILTSYVAPSDANYTQLVTDHTLNFKNITANRQLTLISTETGQRLEVITGNATFKVTFAGVTVKNVDGTTATELPAGKSCVLSYDGTNYQVVSVGAAL